MDCGMRILRASSAWYVALLTQGFAREKVVDVLDRLDYRGERTQEITDDAVTGALLSE